jgi:hypothetical protein
MVPTTEGIEVAIQKLKNNKATRIYPMHKELLKKMVYISKNYFKIIRVSTAYRFSFKPKIYF